MKERITEVVSETAALTEEQEEDGLRPGQEVVTFKHVCGACGHLVALHRHDTPRAAVGHLGTAEWIQTPPPP